MGKRKKSATLNSIKGGYGEARPPVSDVLVQAAQYYYERRKFREDSCPHCARAISLVGRITPACPYCGIQWPKGDLARLTQEDVKELLKRPGYEPSRSEVQRLLSQAEESGVVRFVVAKPIAANLLRKAEESLLSRFPSLKLARVVQGHERLFERKPSSDLTAGDRLRSSVLITAARVAAEEILSILQSLIENGSNPTLCLSWGYSVNLVVKELRPKIPMSEVTVVPFVGALTKHPFKPIFDSNLLVQRAAQALLCEANALWLLSPALVRTPDERRFMEASKLVKEVLETARGADVVALSIKQADPAESDLVRDQLLEEDEIVAMTSKGAIGEISGNYFDKRGSSVDGVRPIGVNLQDLKAITASGRIVLALVATYEERVEPLLTAIDSGMVNALVTDHVTAEALLTRSGTNQ